MSQPAEVAESDHQGTDLVVDVAAATMALRAVGIEPQGMLAAALVHGAADILLADCIARTLPAGCDYFAALGGLTSLVEPQPLPVLQAQVKLLASLRGLLNEPAAAEEVAALAPAAEEVQARLGRLSKNLDEEVAWAGLSLAEAQAA
jgi:hypothetical protein